MKHHPSNDILKKFVGAELSDSLASVVSAHIEKCTFCRNSVSVIEKDLSSDLYSKSDSWEDSFNTVWSNISNQLDNKNHQKKSSLFQQILTEKTEISIGEKKFKMPQSLCNIDFSKMKWMPFGKQGQITRLKGNERNSLLLIYLGPNEEVPLHSHSGAEYSYVISGSFTGEGSEFETGDFAYSDNMVVHSPKATSPDGCLLVSNIEERLNFFQGILKPLNWIFWRFLNWKFARL